MPSRRIEKVNRAILETLSAAILFEVRDPRVKNVTILNVETTGDLKGSKVRVGVRGDAKVQSLTLHGLESSRGFLQSKIADRLQTKSTPILKFVLEPNWLDHLTETSHGFQEAAATAITTEADLAENESESEDDHLDDSDDEDSEDDNDPTE
ncbi:MAG: 30S ribosome-binding factor RbfA [Planctomycetaceae bacterium]|nr:30S ribosome-binding factor RbfA [Planctomycetaceae bacterium]